MEEARRWVASGDASGQRGWTSLAQKRKEGGITGRGGAPWGSSAGAPPSGASKESRRRGTRVISLGFGSLTRPGGLARPAAGPWANEVGRGKKQEACWAVGLLSPLFLL